MYYCLVLIRHFSSSLSDKLSQNTSISGNATYPALKSKLEHTIGINFGQPTSTTHPHLLKNGEILPYISVQELQDRRSRLIERVLRYGMSLSNKVLNHIVSFIML